MPFHRYFFSNPRPVAAPFHLPPEKSVASCHAIFHADIFRALLSDIAEADIFIFAFAAAAATIALPVYYLRPCPADTRVFTSFGVYNQRSFFTTRH